MMLEDESPNKIEQPTPGELPPRVLEAIKESDIDRYLKNSENFSLPEGVTLWVTPHEKKPDQRTQDAFHIDEKRKLYLIADGMGGRAAGDAASRIAVATYQEFFENLIDRGQKYTETDLTATFEAAGQETIARLKIYATQEGLTELGTTITLAHVFVDDSNRTKIFEATVGDSSAYLKTEQEFTKLSYSHKLWILFSAVKRSSWLGRDPEVYQELESTVSQVVAALDESMNLIDLARRLEQIFVAIENRELLEFFKLLYGEDDEKRHERLTPGEYAHELFMTRQNTGSLANLSRRVDFIHSVRDLDPTKPYTLAFFTDGMTDPLRTSEFDEALTTGADMLDRVKEVNTPNEEGKYPQRAKFDDQTGFTVQITH